MKLRNFDGAPVSEVGLGCWQIGGDQWGDVSDSDALDVLRASDGPVSKAELDAAWEDPADTEREKAWVREFTAAFGAARTGGVYLNFEPDTSEQSVRSGYSGEKYARLAALKAEWDPENVFSGNHNIPPATG